MQIIKNTANENGGRPPIQTWEGNNPPEGYAAVNCDTAVFFEFRGFVDLTVEGNNCTAMAGNQEALDAYLAEYPDPEPVEPEPTTEEILNAMLGVSRYE